MDHFFITVQDVWWKFFIVIFICFVLTGLIYYTFRGDALIFGTSLVDVIAIWILFFMLVAVYYEASSALNPQGLAWHEELEMRRSSFFPSPGALVDVEGNHRFSTYQEFYDWVYDYNYDDES